MSTLVKTSLIAAFLSIGLSGCLGPKGAFLWKGQFSGASEELTLSTNMGDEFLLKRYHNYEWSFQDLYWTGERWEIAVEGGTSGAVGLVITSQREPSKPIIVHLGTIEDINVDGTLSDVPIEFWVSAETTGLQYDISIVIANRDLNFSLIGFFDASVEGYVESYRGSLVGNLAQ